MLTSLSIVKHTWMNRSTNRLKCLKTTHEKIVRRTVSVKQCLTQKRAFYLKGLSNWDSAILMAGFKSKFRNIKTIYKLEQPPRRVPWNNSFYFLEIARSNFELLHKRFQRVCFLFRNIYFSICNKLLLQFSYDAFDTGITRFRTVNIISVAALLFLIALKPSAVAS